MESSRSILRASRDSCCRVSMEEACSRGCCSAPKAYTCGAFENGKDIDSGSCCNESEGLITPQEQASVEDASSGATKCSKGCCDGLKVNRRLSIEQHSSSWTKNPGGRGCSTGCCSKRKLPSGPFPTDEPSEPQPCATSCFSRPNPPSSVPGEKSTPYLDNCCSSTFGKCAIDKESSDVIEVVPNTVHPDLKKGITSKDHIILSISGMTCTGCETKLKRALGTLQSVQNLKTSLVLSRAEFDLNCGIQSLDEVLRHLGKTTEFKCERVVDRGSHVDVVP